MRLLVAVIVAGFLLLPLIVGATIINIPDDYPTIQEGIDASSDGDTVLVQPDTYVENINFNGHNVVLASLFLTTGDTSYISPTIIDGDSSDTVILFVRGEDSTAVVTGFTVQNGYTELGGGGICCAWNSNPRIISNTIRGNSASEGGGIRCWESSPTISNNTISDNSALDGGGILCTWSHPTIANNTISSNTGERSAGGIYCEFSSPTIVNNIISGNSVEWFGGGGILCWGSNSTICNNIISENSALDGGGISCWDSNPTINNNIIRGNSAGDGGGISCNNNCNAMVINNTISRNSGGWGGGVYCWLSDLAILNNIIVGNSGWDGGGIILIDSHHATISNSTVSCNSAVSGGAVYLKNSSTEVTNSIFWADSAEVGSEIYVHSGRPAFTYCDIEGGWPGAGNIDIDPLFRDPTSGDFHLQSITSPDCGGPGDSPCIDAGDSSIVDSLISCDWGLGTLRSDMGAYGGGDSLQVGIPEQQENTPTCFYLSQNYPNPFNAATVISYQLPTNNCVRLDIYNLLGQKIATLVDSKQQTGYRSVLWDASYVSSGLYFYKLTAGNFTGTRRMILVR